jgi:hypothetical protein
MSITYLMQTYETITAAKMKKHHSERERRGGKMKNDDEN